MIIYNLIFLPYKNEYRRREFRCILQPQRCLSQFQEVPHANIIRLSDWICNEVQDVLIWKWLHRKKHHLLHRITLIQFFKHLIEPPKFGLMYEAKVWG